MPDVNIQVWIRSALAILSFAVLAWTAGLCIGNNRLELPCRRLAIGYSVILALALLELVATAFMRRWVSFTTELRFVGVIAAWAWTTRLANVGAWGLVVLGLFDLCRAYWIERGPSIDSAVRAPREAP